MFDDNPDVTMNSQPVSHVDGRLMSVAPSTHALVDTHAHLLDDFYQILESSDDMMIILDKDENILWHNPSAHFILTAYGNKPIIHAKISSLILNDEFLDKFRDAFQVITTAHQHQDFAKQMFKFSGQVYRGEIYQVTLTALNHTHSNNSLLNHPASNHTQSKQTNHHILLKITNHTYIHHLEQMRTDFVGNVSHEMRTPLTVLMGYIETFSNAPNLEPKWRRGFTLMNEQARRMNNLVNDLLMLSRLEHDDKEQLVEVDMPRLLMQVFDDARASNKDFGHLLDIHLDTERHVLGLEQYLYSAIFNLVINAMKYTPSDSSETGRQGEIEILWEETADGGLLSITDNGIGIEEAHLARLTERFYRVDSGRSRATGGTGLGLAIVKHVLHKHGAILHVESVLGQGSTFKILFPKDRLI